MFIVNKDKTNFVNLNEIENIFIGNNSIKANMKSGKGMQLGAYNTLDDTQIAMDILLEKISNNSKIFIQMPNDKEIQAKILLKPIQKQTSLKGKKSKGYGGS